MTVIPFPLSRTFDKPGKWDFEAPAQILVLPVIRIERDLPLLSLAEAVELLDQRMTADLIACCSRTPAAAGSD